MMRKTSILQQIKQAVATVDPFAQIVLFGSQARGDAHGESDWDILIITDREVTQSYKTSVRDQLYRVELDLGICIESLFVDKKKWGKPTVMPLYLEIKKDGILL